ncbi:transducin beta-like protein 3 isoform X2 [Ptychodera flava]
MFCQCNEKIQILETETGKVSQSIVQVDEEEITCYTVSPDDQVLVIAARNLLLRQWDWKENQCTRTWKAIHMAPIASMAFDSTSTLLATGGSDSTIKIWDVIKQYCTHNLKGSQGVVSIVQYHPDISKLQLFSAADDYKIRIWDLQTSRCIASLESHFSAVTDFCFVDNGDTLLSCGRDSVVVVWDLTNNTAKKTIPVYETVEGVMSLPSKMYNSVSANESDLHFITAGSKGVLRVWNGRTGQCVYTQQNSIAVKCTGDDTSPDEQPSSNITQLQMCEALDAITVVTFDHNIILYKAQNFQLIKQFVGYNDEVLDIKFMGEKQTHIAVATNSEQIRIFDLSTLNCQILTGHSDIVLSLDVFKDGLHLVSSSKDCTIRLWRMDSLTGEVCCIAKGSGHTHSVGTVATSRLSSKFIVSGSQDNTMKVWKMPTDTQTADSGMVSLQVNLTEKAHDKDINSLAVSPNDKLIASGSQDRSVKLWNADTASLQGVFRGHRRGIWCVQFSPVDQVLATSSGDGTIKLWALTDFSCIKSFEGHDCSVLKVTFISRGMQLLSSGSDGIVKLWTIKNNECVNTFDEHEDKCWALVAKATGDYIVTGAADSSIILWQDVTEIEKEEEASKQEHIILQEQELSNLLQQKKFLKAIGLAITLNQPFKLLQIIKDILNEPGGVSDLDKTIGKLREDQIASVLDFAVQWNTNSKHCHQAQTVLKVVLQKIHPEDLVKYPNVKECLEGFLPYTERHFQRMDRLLQQSMFVEYTWQKMRLVSGENTSLELSSQEPMDVQTKETFFTVDKAPDRKLRIGHHSESESESESEEDESKVPESNMPVESDSESSNESGEESAEKIKVIQSGTEMEIPEHSSEKCSQSESRTNINIDVDQSESDSDSECSIKEKTKRNRRVKARQATQHQTKMTEVAGKENFGSNKEKELKAVKQKQKTDRDTKKAVTSTTAAVRKRKGADDKVSKKKSQKMKKVK